MIHINRMQPRNLTIAFAALAIAGSVLLTACGGKKEEQDSKKVTADTTASISVVSSVLKAGPFEDWGTYSADLRGTDDAVLTAPAPGGGRVNKVSAVGTKVAKGQPLCDIESDLYLAQLNQARAAVELAKGEVERARDNVKQGFVGKAVADKADFDFQGSRAALLQAERAYANSRCEAPFAGVLVSRSVEAFQSVGPGMPTVRVAGLSRLEARISIPESEADGYREGQKAEFTALQGGKRPILGTISSLDRAVEASNRVVMARVQVGNPADALRPGMIGKVRILRKHYESVLVVASSAVLRLQEGTAVMRIENGRARQVPVTLGPSKGDSVVILSGLSAGDRIITVGAFQVSEGTKVKF